VGRSFIGSLATAATSLRNKVPTPYVSGRNLAFPWTQLSGAEAQMRAMGSVGTLFSIVNRLSNAVALVDWKLWRKAPSGLKEDRVEVTRHAALDLWNKPNAFMTRQELVEAFEQHIELTGEGWLSVAHHGRSPMPLELWPVRPDRMMPVPHPTDFLSGYEYTGPSGEKIPLKLNEVIFLRTPNPLDPYRGMGAVQSILIDLDSTRASAEWNQAFFRNSAEPGGIIEVPKHLEDDEFEEMTARWQEQHQGTANAHRVAVIESGAKWIERKYTQRDMQFVELRQASRDTIREAFGVPAFVLGEVGDVNRATAEASKVLFAELLTVPRLERIKQALNNDLLPMYGAATAAGLEFDYEDPVPQDAAARNAELTAKTSAYETLIKAQADPRLAAEYLGLPDLGYRAPAALPAPAAPTAVPVPVPAARLDIHHHAAPQVTGRAIPGTLRTRPVLPAPRAADDDVAEEVREPLDDALDVLLDRWEQVADAQYEELSEQIQAAVDKGDTAALASLTVGTDDASTVLRGALADMAETGAAQMVAEAAGQGVKVRPPKLDKRLRNAFGSELVEIAAATAALLGADMAASAGREALRLLVPGADGEGVAGQVIGFLRGLKNWFRRDQLGGALHRAQNTGRLETLAVAPTARYFSDERRDRNTCLPCAEVDGTEFADLAAARAAYATGGYLRCEGGVRCRGTIRASWE
jgi:HK97 family phage portal protein